MNALVDVFVLDVELHQLLLDTADLKLPVNGRPLRVLAPEAPNMGNSNSKDDGGDGDGKLIGEDGGLGPIIIFVTFVARAEPELSSNV